MDDIFPYILSITTLKQLNACRLFFKSPFLSELTDIDGNHLLQGFLHGDNSKISPTILHWPKQGSLDSNTWNVWSKVITHLYCVKSNSSILRKEKKLGQWFTSNFTAHSCTNSLIPLSIKKFMNIPRKLLNNGSHQK